MLPFYSQIIQQSLTTPVQQSSTIISAGMPRDDTVGRDTGAGCKRLRSSDRFLEGNIPPVMLAALQAKFSSWSVTDMQRAQKWLANEARLMQMMIDERNGMIDTPSDTAAPSDTTAPSDDTTPSMIDTAGPSDAAAPSMIDAAGPSDDTTPAEAPPAHSIDAADTAANTPSVHHVQMRGSVMLWISSQRKFTTQR
jgi:hypothetical protein